MFSDNTILIIFKHLLYGIVFFCGVVLLLFYNRYTENVETLYTFS